MCFYANVFQNQALLEYIRVMISVWDKEKAMQWIMLQPRMNDVANYKRSTKQ